MPKLLLPPSSRGGGCTRLCLEKPRGWRLGILTGTVLALITFIINITLSTISMTHGGDARLSNANTTTLFEGNCDQVRQMNMGAHFLINLLSTLLLGASNYAMQCLSAPTRQDVDKAHALRTYLNIGVMSPTNLTGIGSKRVCLWLLLFASSFPLHLFYNAVVYASIYSRDYLIFSATEDMIIHPDSPRAEPWLGQTNDTNIEGYNTAQTLRDRLLADELRRMEPQECIQAYATEFQTAQGSVILVTKGDSVETSLDSETVLESIFSQYQYSLNGKKCKPHAFEWICGGSGSKCPTTREPCERIWQTDVDANDWSPRGSKVDYCLSEDLEALCRLQFDKRLAYVVIAFNAVKVLVLAYIFLGVREKPLLTVGDAVASFMRKTDLSTAGRCLISRRSDQVMKWQNWIPSKGQPYDPRPKRWRQSVGGGRWCITMIIFITAIALCVFLLVFGITNRPTSQSELLTLPFGAIDPRAFIFSWGGPPPGGGGDSGTVLWNAFVANLPQVALSFLYFAYNGLFTCFLLGYEWTSYSVRRKGLRVSHGPEGAQRSTYFLQLPYRYSVPLITLSGFLHWLCSQSIFLVSVFVDSSVLEGPDQPLTEIALCGYSPPAILTLVLVGGVMVVVAWGMGLRRFPTGMPVAGSCSVVMSALCHLPESEDGVASAVKPVQWGATTTGEMDDAASRMHCSFSAHEVYEPIQGVLYAGLSRRQ